MTEKSNSSFGEANKNPPPLPPPPPPYEGVGVVHGYGNSEKYNRLSSDEVDVTSATLVNAGIETSDPSKLNQPAGSSRVSPKKKPSEKRLIFRFAVLLASFGALMFMAGAPLYSKNSTPSGANEAAIVFNYIVSSVSIIVSLFFILLYFLRLWKGANKISRWLLHAIDLVLGVSYGFVMVYLIKGFSCKPGTEGGWCDFYNFSIFFNVACFLLYAGSFFWDIGGTFKLVRK